jgi:uncharacterized protein (TIGR02996 family)
VTTEDDFQRRLDRRPDDWQTRLVFADWLEERGDPRAGGYRAMGANRLCPQAERRWVWNARLGRWNTRRPKVWMWMHTVTGRSRGAVLKSWWHALLPAHVFDSRRDAEDSAALAFSKLSPDRKAEVTRGTGVCVA